LHQYLTLVKPAFEDFCLPTKKYADVIIPRGADNYVAIDLIVQHIQGEQNGCGINVCGFQKFSDLPTFRQQMNIPIDIPPSLQMGFLMIRKRKPLDLEGVPIDRTINCAFRR